MHNLLLQNSSDIHKKFSLESSLSLSKYIELYTKVIELAEYREQHANIEF